MKVYVKWIIHLKTELLARFENFSILISIQLTNITLLFNKGQTDPVKACGQCGILYDSAFPTGAKVL